MKLAARFGALAMWLAPVALTPLGCGPSTAPRTLGAYNLFEGDGRAQTPARRVVYYDVRSPLFSDETVKRRFVYVPEGATIGYHDTNAWSFPVGTIVIKSFAYPVDARDPARGERILETRLLVRTETGWTPHTYVWNEAQSEAVRTVGGAVIPVRWTDRTGASRAIDYTVPNTNQCATCHGSAASMAPLGLRTRQVDRTHDYGDGRGAVNQLEHFAALGMLDRAPGPAGARSPLASPDDESAPLEARARGYLEANCAHCHNRSAEGNAAYTGLSLGIDETDEARLGFCRRPFAAAGSGGRLQDIVPGNPDASLLLYRIRSTQPDIKMPPIPSQLVDATGADLVARWIAAMPPRACPSAGGP